MKLLILSTLSYIIKIIQSTRNRERILGRSADVSRGLGYIFNKFLKDECQGHALCFHMHLYWRPFYGPTSGVRFL